MPSVMRRSFLYLGGCGHEEEPSLPAQPAGVSGDRNQQGIDGLEDIMLEAVWLKHDGHLRRRATRRGRLGHGILLHRVERCLRGMIQGRKMRRGTALPGAYAGGYAQSLCHIPTPVSFWQDSGKRVLEAGLSRACWYGRG